MISLELGQILTQALGFIILLYFLKRLAWGRIAETLETRRQRIASQFSDAEKMRQEAEQLRQEFERRMREIEETTHRKMQEGIAEGQRIAREIQERARTECQQMIQTAQEEIGKGKERALLELREQVTDLSIALAAKLIKRDLTPGDHARLTEEFLKEMESVNARGQRAD